MRIRLFWELNNVLGETHCLMLSLPFLMQKTPAVLWGKTARKKSVIEVLIKNSKNSRKLESLSDLL